MPKPIYSAGYLRLIMVLSWALVLAFSACRTVASRQYKDGTNDNEVDGTYNTTRDPYYKLDRKSAKIYIAIYTKRTQHYLVGNGCMREYTRSIGFEYQPYDEYPHEQYGPIAFHFYNITSRVGMIIKRGPLWKEKINKRLAQCRRASGDFIGLVNQPMLPVAGF